MELTSSVMMLFWENVMYGLLRNIFHVELKFHLFFGIYFTHDVQNPHNKWAMITTAEIKDTFNRLEVKKI